MSGKDFYEPTPQPHHIPGYAGHCPFYSKRIGETYGVATHRALLESSGKTLTLGLLSDGQSWSHDKHFTGSSGAQNVEDKRGFGFTREDHRSPSSRAEENHCTGKALPECQETPFPAKNACKVHTQPQKGWCDGISHGKHEISPMSHQCPIPIPAKNTCKEHKQPRKEWCKGISHGNHEIPSPPCPRIPCAPHYPRGPSTHPENAYDDFRSPCPEPHSHNKMAYLCPKRETTYSFSLSDVRPEVTANVTYGVHCIEPSYLPSSSSPTPYFVETKHPDKGLKPGKTNQSVEWATLSDIAPVMPPSGHMIYPTYTGMLPTYGGHVPGQLFQFGKTFGKETKDAKRWIRGDFS